VAGASTVATWSAARGLSTVAQGAVHPDLVAWSPDGKSLAYVVGDSVKSSSATAPLAQPVAGVTALGWSPDGAGLAVATPAAVLLVARDGTTRAAVDAHAASDGALCWTVIH